MPSRRFRRPGRFANLPGLDGAEWKWPLVSLLVVAISAGASMALLMRLFSLVS